MRTSAKWFIEWYTLLGSFKKKIVHHLYIYNIVYWITLFSYLFFTSLSTIFFLNLPFLRFSTVFVYFVSIFFHAVPTHPFLPIFSRLLLRCCLLSCFSLSSNYHKFSLWLRVCVPFRDQSLFATIQFYCIAQLNVSFKIKNIK